ERENAPVGAVELAHGQGLGYHDHKYIFGAQPAQLEIYLPRAVLADRNQKPSRWVAVACVLWSRAHDLRARSRGRSRPGNLARPRRPFRRARVLVHDP